MPYPSSIYDIPFLAQMHPKSEIIFLKNSKGILCAHDKFGNIAEGMSCGVMYGTIGNEQGAAFHAGEFLGFLAIGPDGNMLKLIAFTNKGWVWIFEVDNIAKVSGDA